jgi:hypothetical protein
MLLELLVVAVPLRADGRVAGRWSRRGHLWLGQDAQSRIPTIVNHTIDAVGEVLDLQLEVVDRAGPVHEVTDCFNLAGEIFNCINLVDEIGHRRVDLRLPHQDLLHFVLDGLEASTQAVHGRLEGRQMVVELLHLVEE